MIIISEPPRIFWVPLLPPLPPLGPNKALGDATAAPGGGCGESWLIPPLADPNLWGSWKAPENLMEHGDFLRGFHRCTW